MPRYFDRSFAKILLLNACLVLAALQLSGCSSREQRAKSYYDHGMSYLEKKDYVKARIELRNAVQLKGDMVEAWRALAQVEEHEKNWQGLAGSLRRVVEIDPKDIKSTIGLARIYLLAGALDNALKMANTAGDLDPKNVGILALKAAILLRQKDTNGAIETAQKALEIEPDSPDANVVLAVAKFSQGDSNGALKLLAKVKDTHKNDLGVLLLEINIFDRMGNLEQTEALLRKLIALYPKEPAFRTQLVRFFIAHKRQDDAEKELRAAVAANPDDLNAEFELVNILGSVKGPTAARTELVRRINEGGRVFPYQIALAKIEFAQGDIAAGTKLLDELIANSKAPDDIAIARAALAEIYLSKNNVAAAEPLVTEILRADSRNINGLRLRALIHLARGQTDDAIADLRSALNDQPQSPELLASLALAYERSGSIELADKAFFDATKAAKFAPAVGLNYVAFLRRRGMNTQAESVLNDLATRNPNSIPVLTALSQEKLAHQDWTGAHAVANAIHRLDDKSAVADQINAAAFTGEKKFNDSLTLLQSAYDANPGAVQPMAALVGGYLRAKQIDKAEAFLQSVLKAKPANVEALVLLGSVQVAKNNPQEAVKDFETAIKEQPKDVMGYRALANYYVSQKKIDEALKVIHAGLQQQPENFALRLTLAGLLEAKGDFESAISEYESMLKQQPGSMIVANNLASLLADHRTDKASLERANSLAVLLTKSQIPQFKDTVGWIAYQQANYTTAIQLLEAAVAALPDVPLIHYHLGMTYLAIGQATKASDQFKKATELAPNDADLKTKIDAALKGRSEKVKG